MTDTELASATAAAIAGPRHSVTDRPVGGFERAIAWSLAVEEEPITWCLIELAGCSTEMSRKVEWL